MINQSAICESNLPTEAHAQGEDNDEAGARPSLRIIEQKQALKEQKANEEKYRTIFDTASTAMVSFGDDSIIRLANDGWTKLTGYSKEETEGKLTWMPFFTGETLARMKRYHEMRGKDPNAVPRLYEAQLVDRYGKIHDGIVNINVIRGTHERVASFQDLTELKRAQKEMYRADKMAALGQIIAGVAHEINNPNNFIYFNLPILQKYIDSIRPLLDERADQDKNLSFLNMPYNLFIEDIYKLLENMRHGSTRITDIVSDLKHYVHSSETEDKKPEPIDAVIKQVMILVGKQVRKHVKKLDVQVAESLPMVSMNSGKIEQVLINLVINAGQAADKENSWVRLTARNCAYDDKLVEILVEDNGSGIPKENLHSIFEPFFTTKADKSGTGLGLAVSYQIIKDHGGTINVTSKVGQNTKFTVRLPAIEDKRNPCEK